MNTIRKTLSVQAAGFAMASIMTLAVLAGLGAIADRSVADERVAQGAQPVVQQVVVSPMRAPRS